MPASVGKRSLLSESPQTASPVVLSQEPWKLQAYEPQSETAGSKPEAVLPEVETLDPPPDYALTSPDREQVETLLVVKSQQVEAAAEEAKQDGGIGRAHALYKRARRLANKAKRYADCRLYGYERVCSGNFLHKFYQRYGCGLRFCQPCAPMLFRNLFRRCVGPLVAFMKSQPYRKGYTLARINFTLRSSGDVPKSEEIKKFNCDIRDVLKAETKAVFAGDDDVFGVLWVDEFGYEKHGRRAGRKAGGLNLHAHGLYYGPYLDWERLRDRYQNATGSLGVWLTEIKGWRRDPELRIKKALAHMLKYVSKVPAVTPERIAAFEFAFAGVRRVHTLGKFYKLKLKLAEKDLQGVESGCGVCPLCRSALLVPNKKTFSLRRVEEWENEGHEDIDAVRSRVGKESVLSARGP